MAFTLEQLQAKRDSIITQMSSPEAIASGSNSVRNRTFEQLDDALRRIDAEIEALQNPSTAVGRQIRLYSTSGL